MKSGQTIFRAEGRHTEGPKEGWIKWVRYYAGTRSERKYRLRHKMTQTVGDLGTRIKKRVRVSKHRGTKSTHRHQSR